MCTPLAIAGIALTAASTVANTVAANKVQKARNDALAAERIRQQGYDQQAQALNVQSQDRYQGFEGQQTERGQQLGDYFKDQTVAQNDANAQANAEMEQAALPDASGITVAEDKKQAGNARAFTDAQGAALGNLRSFGDLMGSIGRLQARDAMSIGQIGGFKKGSSAVLPYELDAASQAGASANLIGDLLGMGGQLALGKGLQGSFVTPSVGGGVSTSIGKAGSLAAGRAADLASVPGYSAYSLYGSR